MVVDAGVEEHVDFDTLLHLGARPTIDIYYENAPDADWTGMQVRNKINYDAVHSQMH